MKVKRRPSLPAVPPPRFLNIPVHYLVALFLFVVPSALFFQVRHHEFFDVDDPPYVTQNAHVQMGLARESIGWAFTAIHSANWHPLTWLSHMLDCRLFGLDPFHHHLTNVYLHSANAVLLFLLLRMLTGALWRAAFVAAVFAVHPLAVESVAWVAERKNVLSTFFWFLTMALYARYVRRPTGRAYGWVALSLALGLMAKPMLVTLPVVLFLMDFWPLNRAGPPRSVQSLIFEKIPLMALAAASSAITIVAQKSDAAMYSLKAISLSERLVNALLSFIKYIGLMVWPGGLAFFYPYDRAALTGLNALGFGAALAAVTGMAVASFRRRPYLAFGWFWYLVTLLPVIGLVQVGSQALADRYTYVPLIGLYVIIAWGVHDLTCGVRGARITAAVAAFVVIAALARATWVQTGLWRDSVTMYTHAIRVTRDNDMALYNLGNLYLKSGRYADAVEHYSESVRINDRDPWVLNNLGYALHRAGNRKEAVVQYTKAIQLKPDYGRARYNLGNALAEEGNYAEAEKQFAEAVRYDPANQHARANLEKVRAILR